MIIKEFKIVIDFLTNQWYNNFIKRMIRFILNRKGNINMILTLDRLNKLDSLDKLWEDETDNQMLDFP